MLKRFLVISLFAAVSFAGLLLLPEKPVETECCEEEEEVKTIISVYDPIMRSAEAESGIDWRLLSAIAYIESRFHSGLVSKRGAVGIMQIMPSIGRHYGIGSETLAKPNYNIRVAAFLLCEIESAIGLPQGLPEKDRLGIVLACYNGGIGHVSDARRLARAYGDNANSWADVSHYLRMKNEPEYYEHNVVKYGKFSGGRHTVAYVRDVMKRYEHYRKITEKTAINN